MSAQAEARLGRYSPVELIDAVRAGRIRYPNPPRPSAFDTARVVDGLRRGFPVRPLLLWQDPAEPVLWVLDGGDVVAALLVASGVIPTGPDDEPLRFDADTGEVVSWGQRPADDPDGVTLALAPAYDLLSVTVYERFSADHMAFRLAGERSFDKLGRDHFRRMADTVGADPDLIVQVVDRTVDALRATWPSVVAEHPVPGFLRTYLDERLRTLPLLRER